jgi:hypothetical protein
MKIKYLFLLLALTSSCSSEQKDLYEFDPRSLHENRITLAEIADDIIYIPLDNSYPIGVINKLIITNNSIFLNSVGGIVAFNRDGKRARKIGNKGRGPGEYIYSTTFTVDNKHETVYVKDRGNIIKVYSANGNFLRSISLQEILGDIDVIEFFDSRLFVSYFLQFGDAKFNWIVIDTLGNLIIKKERTMPLFWSNWSLGGGTFKFKNKLSYWNPYNDTIFSILPDLTYKASFLLSAGEHRLPRSQFDLDKQFSLYMHLHSIIETSRFLVVEYFYKNRVIALIDKKSKKSFLTYLEKGLPDGNQFGGIVNNLDGGTTFQPQSYFAENDQEYMVGLINPYQLRAYVLSNEFKNTTPKYPEKKKELEKLANSLTETDNLVLTLVRLKK